MTRRLGALPLVCLLTIVGYASYGAAVTGHWPTQNNPDPKDLPLRPLLYVADLVYLIGALSVVLLPVAYGVIRVVAAWRKRSFGLRPGTLSVYFSGVLLWVADFALIHVRGPVPSVLDWFLD